VGEKVGWFQELGPKKKKGGRGKPMPHGPHPIVLVAANPQSCFVLNKTQKIPLRAPVKGGGKVRLSPDTKRSKPACSSMSLKNSWGFWGWVFFVVGLGVFFFGVGGGVSEPKKNHIPDYLHKRTRNMF